MNNPFVIGQAFNMAKRVMVDIVSSPLVLMPFMVGSMAFASLFALGLKGSAAVGAVLIGLVGMLANQGLERANRIDQRV